MEPMYRIPLGDWVEVGLDWLTTTLDGFFVLIRSIFVGAYDGLDWVLTGPSSWCLLPSLGGPAAGSWAWGPR